MKNQTVVSFMMSNISLSFSSHFRSIYIEAMNKRSVTNAESINYNLITIHSQVGRSFEP